jgi:hypothetical protein
MFGSLDDNSQGKERHIERLKILDKMNSYQQLGRRGRPLGFHD